MEAARSDRQISLMQKDLAYEIVHRNTIALQFNRIMLEQVERDLHAADKLIGCIHLTIRESGHSPTSEYAMREPLARCHSQPGSKFCFSFLTPSLLIDLPASALNVVLD